jgi:O-antigen/teichoic acid export membrane protein
MSLWRTILLAVNLVGVRFGGAAIGLASQILLARLLTQHDVGVVFLGMSAAAFISLLITGGYPILAITCLPRYYALGRKNLVRAFHAALLQDSLWITLASFGLATAAYFWLPLNDGLKIALLFGCLSAPASALAYLLFAWAMGIQLSIAHVLWAFVAMNTIVALAQAWLIGEDGARSGLKWSGRHNLAPVLRSRAAALVIVGIVTASFADVVTLIAGFFLNTADVALVGVTIRLAALAGFITQATQQFILPDLTAAMTRGTPHQVHALLLRINMIALAAILACVAGAILLGPWALRIFGSEYGAGHWPLVLFMVSQAFRAASGMNQHLLSLAGYQIKTAGSCLVAMAILVGAAAFFTPGHGVMGIAYAVLLADAVWAGLLALQTQRLTGRRGDMIGVLLEKKS